MDDEESTVDVLKDLRNDIVRESQDAANMGDRVAAGIFSRLATMLTRNIERREAMEAGE